MYITSHLILQEKIYRTKKGVGRRKGKRCKRQVSVIVIVCPSYKYMSEEDLVVIEGATDPYYNTQRLWSQNLNTQQLIFITHSSLLIVQSVYLK